MRSFRSALLSTLVLLCPWIAALAAQDRPASPLGEVQAARVEQSTLTLETLRQSILAREKELEEKQRAIEQATSGERKQQLLAEANQILAAIDRLRLDFDSVATGIDVAAYQLGPREDLDLKSEVMKLLAPIIDELKAATEEPRQIEELRSALTHFEERQRLARDAIRNMDNLLAVIPPGELRTEVERSRQVWEQRVRDIQSQASVARYQLETRLEKRRSLIDSSRSALSEFFRSRGLNLLVALVTFFAVFLAFRWLYALIRRVSPIHRRPDRPFYARLLDVLYHGFTGLTAIAGALLVLYAAGDWVLLGIALLFLLGLAWASKNTLPQFFDQIRILLNFGPVRELERVVYNGLPWRVSRIGVHAVLTNPDLAGSIVRLPVRELTGMRSRPCLADEVWFPSRKNDYVRLNDGKFGQVVHQSPEAVRLRLRSGTTVTYPTSTYLDLCPENLSQGFMVVETFGIDYEHQAISTTRVPQVMRARLEAALLETVSAEDLTALVVDFKAAGASSLDYGVYASFRGTVAERAEALRRTIQRALVDVCNDQGWVIPFMQVTVHEAAKPPLLARGSAPGSG